MARSDEDSAWQLTQELVRIDSSDPGAYEGEIERFIKTWLKGKAGDLPEGLADVIDFKELEVLPGRTELMATIPGTTDEPGLVFICHMDTVQLGDGWDEDIDPLGAQVRENRLYGRGACDMKSGLACAMVAFAAELERVNSTGTLPNRGLSLICSVDEEDFMRGVEAAIAAGWVGSTEWVLDCEPTDAQIQVAHKGRTWFELTMRGITAHASQPWQGADAIAAMACAITHIRKAVNAQPKHAELGPSTVTFGQIEGGYSPYVVPDECKVWIDMRLVPPATTAWATEEIEEAITAAESEVPGCHGEYEITGDRPAIERDPSSPLLAALLKATEETCGSPAEIGIFTGYTDTAVIAGKTGNPNCMSYGPGSLALAHKPNEYVAHEDVTRVQAVLNQLVQDVCR
jgi:succinyl-diaminopimelate desuccinylase